ncbi:hypothetical protein D3C84_898650 [compost metagenome]
MADARRHGPQRRQFARLHQVILGTYKVLLSLLAFQHFLFQSTVEAFQVAGPFGHPTFQFASGLGFEGDPLQVVAAPLHHQAEQQHDHQQRGATDGDHGPYRPVDQGARGEDADVPAGFRDRLGLGQPGVRIEFQRSRITGRVGLDRADRLALVFAQWSGCAKAPFWP